MITLIADGRFWSKVEPEPNSGCWLFLGADNGHGYGVFPRSGRSRYAHRFAYEELVGPIPQGLVIDHKCRVRRCVNPKHLEAVTVAVNVERAVGRDECRRGHLKPVGTGCRECHAAREHQRRARLGGKAARQARGWCTRLDGTTWDPNQGKQA